MSASEKDVEVVRRRIWLRNLLHGFVWVLLLIPLVFDVVLPTSWWLKYSTSTGSIVEMLDSRFLSGNMAFMVLVFTVPSTLLAAIIGGCMHMDMPHIQFARIPFMSSDMSVRVILVSVLLFAQVGYFLVGLRKGYQEWLGYAAMVNMQFLLLPVCRSSPLLSLFRLSPENIVCWHRFVGWTTVLLLLGHGASFSIPWARQGEGVLFKMILSWQGLVPILPGVIAVGFLLILAVTSYYQVRRKCYELFLYTHKTCSLLFLVFAGLHYPKLLWWTSASLLLYIADYVTQLPAWNSARLVKNARFAQGVLSLKLDYTSDLSSPQPLQWVMLQVPDISVMQWHPFTVAYTTDDGFVITMKVIPGGWNDMLSKRLMSNQDTYYRVAGFYGQGYLHGRCHDRPLCMIAGGSGVTPFTAILQTLEQDRTVVCSSNKHRHSPPMLLVWCCRHKSQLKEYMRQLRMLELVQRCPKLMLQLFVTGPIDDACTVPLIGSTSCDSSPFRNPERVEHATAMKRKLVVVLCHGFVASGGIIGLAAGYQCKLNAVMQLILLLGGAFAGGFLALLLTSVPWRGLLRRTSSIESHYTGVRNPDLNTSSLRSQDCFVSLNGWLQTSERGGEVADQHQILINEERLTWHEGRPNLMVIMKKFQDQCEFLGFQRSVSVMSSGPAGLVEAASKVASSCGLEHACMSFEL